MTDLTKTKTFWLGVAAIGLAALKTQAPEAADLLNITLAPDALLLTGFGLIFGRDAVRKIGGVGHE